MILTAQNTPLLVAFILLIGLAGGQMASKCNLPSVTGYILFGLLIGPSGGGLLTRDMIKSLQFVNDLALGILAISLGLELHRYVLKSYGRSIFEVSLGTCLFTFVMTAATTTLLGLPTELAIILGVLTMTVSPTGVAPVIREYNAQGELSSNLMAIVALNNLICIVLFGLVTALLKGHASAELRDLHMLVSLGMDIGLAVMLGYFSGVAAGFALRWNFNSNRFLVLLIALILLNTGMAYYLALSSILVNITAGSVLVNLSNKKYHVISTIERIQLPVMIMFLTLAGAKIDLALVAILGLVGTGYIFARFVGLVLGGWFAGGLADLDNRVRSNIGLALTPQAGIAIGLSIIAEQKFPHFNGAVAGIVLTGVLFFEVLGPLLVKIALINTGDIPPKAK